MISRVGLGIVAVALVVGGGAGAASSRPSSTTAVYTIRADPRLCPSPLCGGYWVALANGARTRCADGVTRARCYVAVFVGRPVVDGGLALGSVRSKNFDGLGNLGVLAVEIAFAPAGTATLTGGYYRAVDTGIRCVRAPCFSYRATQINGSTRTTMSDVDLGASLATPAELARAQAALHSKSGLLARGRFSSTSEGGRVFRASRLYLRAPLPRA